MLLYSPYARKPDFFYHLFPTPYIQLVKKYNPHFTMKFFAVIAVALMAAVAQADTCAGSKYTCSLSMFLFTD